jgi:hypothetical protein
MGKTTTTTKSKAAPKRAAKPAAAAKVTTAEKPKTKRAPAKRLTARRPAKTIPTISSEDIALRAYFIAQDRQQFGRPGTPEGDWFEAERQLRSEHGLN